jgi:hypothetical protein
MGAGQQLADAFLAHSYRLLFGEKATPTVNRAKLVVVWTIEHAIRYNVGLVVERSNLRYLRKIMGFGRLTMKIRAKPNNK